MKRKLGTPILFFVAFILVVGLACGASAPDTPAEPAPVEDTVVEEDAPPPPPPTAVPEPTEPAAQQFYTEEFDDDTSLWTYFLVKGQPAAKDPIFVEDDFGTMFVGTDGGRLVYNLESGGQWAYVTYDAYEYENVRLDIVVENRGVNNNNVSLICRYSDDEGWYEYNVANNGLYWLYHGIVRDDGFVIYNELANGGSNKIKAGKETNEYAMVCSGRALMLYVNGHETGSFEDNNYVLRDGLVGVSVSSFDTLPVKIEIDSITISEP